MAEKPMLLLLIGLVMVFAACTLVLMAPLSLEVNTTEQKYIFRLAWFLRIQYGCPQHQGRCLRFSLFGCSWVKGIRWPAWDRKRLKKIRWLPVKERHDLGAVLLKVKDAWYDLQRLSSRELEINLCTPDFMANALLSLVLADLTRQGIRISVNYLEENWLIGFFSVRVWAVVWISLKFTLSRPVSRLGLCAIRSRLKR